MNGKAESPDCILCSPNLQVIPAQLIRSGIGQNVSCAVGDFALHPRLCCQQEKDLVFMNNHAMNHIALNKNSVMWFSVMLLDRLNVIRLVEQHLVSNHVQLTLMFLLSWFSL